MASGDVLTFTEGNFEEEVIKSGEPVLVDFWAVWCAPCILIAPTVESIAKDYSGRVKVGRVNVDENSQLAVRYGIRAIPTLLLFKDGKVAEQMIGAQPREAIEAVIKKYLQ